MSVRSAVAGRSDRCSQPVQAAFDVPLLEKRDCSEHSDALLNPLYEHVWSLPALQNMVFHYSERDLFTDPFLPHGIHTKASLKRPIGCTFWDRASVRCKNPVKIHTSCL